MLPHRRTFLRAAGVSLALPYVDSLAIGADPAPKTPDIVAPARPLLYTGGGPARGNPSPHSFKGDDLVKARLTPESWRLEIVADGGAKVEKPRRLDDGTAIDMPALLELGKKHAVKFIKAMQCRSGNWPQDQAL